MTSTMKAGPNLIMESAIFQEAKIVNDKMGRAIFRMTLQTMDEVNQNQREYPSPVLPPIANPWTFDFSTRCLTSFFNNS